eukprot:6201952-Pleurochrysis_carterae.AAC.1
MRKSAGKSRMRSKGRGLQSGRERLAQRSVKTRLSQSERCQAVARQLGVVQQRSVMEYLRARAPNAG